MYSQLFVRLAVSTAFLSAVADRLGLWGVPGASHVSWGNWANFVAYSNTLNFLCLKLSVIYLLSAQHY
ncbi:Uncharacterised protein [Sphingobacterium multivorum]|uniref:Uncharacterized protein n=1 Tax=Sphingobacterium multivorum TaxID=28454 RepID=A0A2X2JA71_SPHMU|nr:Uncharacterised protein [Sphingobacterium multivorum]